MLLEEQGHLLSISVLLVSYRVWVATYVPGEYLNMGLILRLMPGHLLYGRRHRRYRFRSHSRRPRAGCGG